MAFTFKFAFVIIQCIQSCFSVSHTWRYVFTESKERNSFPELIFSEMVDEQELYYYDSNNKSLIRRYEWLKTLENRAFLDLHFITIDDIQTAYKLNINFIKEFFNHTDGNHTSQVIVGCDVDFEDQTETFFAQTAYDGQDLFDADFDKQTCTMLVDQAESLKQKCNLKERLSPQWTPFWRELCTQWLKDFIIYGNDTLQRKVLGRRDQKNRKTLELNCCFSRSRGDRLSEDNREPELIPAPFDAKHKSIMNRTPVYGETALLLDSFPVHEKEIPDSVNLGINR
ncbi:major histocompatibility complex class I-related gene protein-like [Polypterus senegalus]|uniref:major histocompatibility complex class I-related gene protein-like n=1 Tax=Polypterus senegalus TaxID=55291 RepID=UPI0019624020|nr:major histocompatibility complex class I-related gene protein-like [Polypterus senegalus]